MDRFHTDRAVWFPGYSSLLKLAETAVADHPPVITIEADDDGRVQFDEVAACSVVIIDQFFNVPVYRAWLDFVAQRRVAYRFLALSARGGSDWKIGDRAQAVVVVTGLDGH